MDQRTIDWTRAEMGAINSIASRFRNENLATLIHSPGKHVRFQISDFRFEISDFSFEISDFSFEISDFSFEISDLKFQISDLKFQIPQIKNSVICIQDLTFRFSIQHAI